MEIEIIPRHLKIKGLYIKSVKELSKVVNKTNEIPLEERKNIINSIYDYYDELIKYKYNSEELAEEVIEALTGELILVYAYNEFKLHRNKNIDVEKYTKAKNLIDKVYKYRSEEISRNKFNPRFKIKDYFTKENISMKDFKEALDTFKETYFLSISSDETIKLYEEFKYKNFLKFFNQLKIIYNYVFDEKYELERWEKYAIKTDEEIDKLFTLFKKYMQESNNNYYQTLYNLLRNDNYETYDIYDSMHSFEEYIEKNIDNDQLKKQYIENFKEFAKIAKSFNLGLDGVYNLIRKDISNTEYNRQISFDILYFKNFSSNYVATRLRGKNIYYSETDKIEQYISDYDNYYNKRKEEKTIEKEQMKIDKEKEFLPKAENIVSDFINSSLNSILEYCNLNNMKEFEFRHLLDLLKKYENPLYSEYEKYIESKKAQRYAILVTKISKIFEEMVKANGKFTLLDYYGRTSLTLDEATKIVKDKFNPSQQRLWAQFTNKYKNDLELGQERIKKLLEDSNKIKYCIEMDNKGNILKSYEITRTDKEQALLMLKEKNIPITNATFSLMVKKYYEESILPSITNNKGKTI